MIWGKTDLLWGEGLRCRGIGMEKMQAEDTAVPDFDAISEANLGSVVLF